MPTKKRTNALITLHVIVFIWGFTGILGKEITLPAVDLVWWRTLIASATLWLYGLYYGKALRLSWRELWPLQVTGIITAAHWFCFFASIKAANISTALVVLSTTSLFVALINPFIRGTRILLYEILLGLVILAGLSMVLRFEPAYTTGITLALLSALFAAVFSSLNSSFVQRHPPHLIALHEMTAALLALTIYQIVSGAWNTGLSIPDGKDLGLLVLLGTVATAFAFIQGIAVMRELSAFTCAMTINLEPVYTILLALLFYGEKEYMSLPFYLGSALMISTLFADAWIKRRKAGELHSVEKKKPH